MQNYTQINANLAAYLGFSANLQYFAFFVHNLMFRLKDNFLTYFSNYKSRLLFVKLVSISSFWVIKQLFQIFLGLGPQFIGSSTAPRGDSFDCCTERYEIVVYYINCVFVLFR